jgi:hypothetical protein
MKSTGMTRTETFQLNASSTVGLQSLRIPRPYMARSFAATGAPSTSANLVLSGPVTGIDGYSYDPSVNVGSGNAVSNIENTEALSKNMIVSSASSIPWSNGSVRDLNLISEISSRTELTLDPAVSAGTATGVPVVFTHSGNTPRIDGTGNYPGKFITPPPPSGKLYCDFDDLSSKSINYSSWEIDVDTKKWNFYITGTDESSMPTVSQYTEYLVAGHTTGDGLGQNVRIMWIMLSGASNNKDVVISIKSWETGQTLFKQNSPNYSGTNPQANFHINIPAGGIFCEGGAVFDIAVPSGGSADASFAIKYMTVGYQI